MENKIPIIGIFGWKTGDNSYGCGISYMQYLSSYGIVKILTVEEPIDERIDLIVVPGGADVDPARYGAVPHLYTSKPDPIREYFDTVILPEYIKLGISVYGICRGCQSIAVLFGAQLIQHMYHETNETDRSDTTHGLYLLDTTFKQEFNKVHTKALKVNSMHHQCVSSIDFPDELEILGVYTGKSKYSSIEVIRHKTLPVYAVQYHPEELTTDPLGDFIIQELLSKTKQDVIKKAS